MHQFHHQPRFFGSVCRRYGDIFAKLPKKVIVDLKKFDEWIKDNPTRCSLALESSLSYRWHRVLFDSFFKNHKVHSRTENILILLSQKGRLGELSSIFEYMHQNHNEYKVVYLNVSKKLTQPSLKKLQNQLEQQLKVSVIIKPYEDHALLLGGVLLWDTFMIDFSLSTYLNKLKNKVFYVLSES